MNKNLLFFFLLLYGGVALGQDKRETAMVADTAVQGFKAGIDLGLGRSYIISSYGKNHFTDKYPDNVKIGLLVYYASGKVPIQYKTGLAFSRRGNSETNFVYLQLPLGVDFFIGRKFRIVLGAGFYSSALISSIPEREDKSLFSISFYASPGFQCRISRDMELSINYEYTRDLTKIYSETYSHHGFTPLETTYYFGSDSRFNIGINYLLRKKKKE